jgi:hypothetical protein
MNHERTKAQVAYLFAMGCAPSQEGAPLVTLRGLTQKLLAGGALLLRRARPFSGGRALVDCPIGRGLSQKLLTGGAHLLRRAPPLSGGRALFGRGLIQKLTKPESRTQFA